MSHSINKSGMLHYDAQFKVLICKECKYAIQKRAVESHLLRHKIYRGERQRLLSSVSALELLEPDAVETPPTSSTPIDVLPVMSGHKCMVDGCGYLCASDKRMGHHWKNTHSSTNFPSNAFCSVRLQTFFKGTKLKYFEVASSNATHEILREKDSEAQQGHTEENPIVERPERTTIPTQPFISSLHLETMTYFHHFTTTTTHTLPVHKNKPSTFWESDVVVRALQQPWLMCGLLSISAMHLTILSDDQETRMRHQERSEQLYLQFSTGYKSHYEGRDVDKIHLELGAQMMCVLRCCMWVLSEPHHELTKMPTSFDLPSFLATIQGCGDADIAQHLGVDLAGISEDDFVQAKSKIGENHEAVPAYSHVPVALLQCLKTLPYRMTEVLGKPDNIQDVLTALSAIDALVDCYALSHASDNLKDAWWSMDLWPRTISSRFNRMFWRRDPAALIVVAHWSILLKRVGEKCWLFRGLGQTLLDYIMEELSEKSTILSLLQNIDS